MEGVLRVTSHSGSTPKIKNDQVIIKGRVFADVRKQRNWISKEDTSLPTVSTESLMISCMIDTTESKDVATDDIPGAVLQTEHDKGDIHIKMEG